METQTRSLGSLVATILVVSGIALLPLLFFPFVGEMFDTAKRSSFVLLALVFFIAYAVTSILKRSIEVPRSILTVGFAGFTIVSILSIIFSSPNKMSSLMGAGGFALSLGIVFIVGATLLRQKITQTVIFTLAGAGVLVSIISALEKVGLSLGRLMGNSGTAALAGLYPNGGALINTMVIIVCLLMTITLALTSKQMTTKGIAISFSSILILGLILNAILILPGRDQSPVLLSFRNSWSIALDVLKTPRTALIGVGPEQYVNAFAQFKPGNLNQGSFWFVRFSSARNFPLDVIVTHGALGLAAITLIGVGVVSRLRKTKKDELPLVVAIFAIIAMLLLLPANPVILGLLVLLLITWHAASRTHDETDSSVFTLYRVQPTQAKDAQRVAFGVVGFVSILFTLFSLVSMWFIGQSLIAKSVFASSLELLGQSKAKETYDTMRRAIVMTPYQEDFRRSFSQVNLTLAQGITQNKDLTDEDRRTALQLIQQSIDEAKAAIALNPTDATNWQNLATIYDTLIGAANGADGWTVAAYSQAIVRDPANPKLRLDLGGVYRKLKNNEQASKLFEQSAQLKADYANAYFNMADIARELKRPEQEFALLRRTMELMRPTDPQYGQVKDQVEKLRKELEAKAKEEQAKSPETPAASPRPSATPTPTPRAENSTSSARPRLDLPSNAGIASPSAVPEVPSN